MLRVAMAGEAWRACAPGKLLLERSIAHMHASGCREFDFAIGDYRHKKVFMTTPLPLREACVALSLRGQPHRLHWGLKQAVKSRPSLRAFAELIRRGMRGPQGGAAPAAAAD
jgi:CelD/BcsL family acetyltransferase involved in cellulose biosynthesis